MHINEIITESLSPIVYHYTRLYNALKILSSGNFELSSSIGSIEHQYAPKGHPYFMSTTRTKMGGYHNTLGSDAVMFVMDGRWYNQRYPAKSVDYWLDRNPKKSFGREHEAEDRLFSKEPIVPVDGVTEIHVYLKPNSEPEDIARTRQLFILAKRRGISTYLYNDKEGWRIQDPRKRQDFSQLRKGIDDKTGFIRLHKGELIYYIELLKAKEETQLSDRAKKILYTVRYDFPKGYYRQDMVKRFESDLANGRRPGTGPDRRNAIKIISFMNKNGFETAEQFLQYLHDKWKSE
jgi:hypothetical protein